jgi:branched-chain amino acid transport system permease protein
VAVLCAAALAAAVLLATSEPDYNLGLWTQAVAYMVAILGLNLIVGHAGQFSLAQSAFVGLGAYTSVILVVDHGWPFLATLPASLFLGFLAGFLLGLPALRIRGHYLTMLTLAVALSFPALVTRFASLTGGANGMVMILRWEPPAWLPFTVSATGWFLLVTVAIAIVAFVLVENLLDSRVGRALQALRTNDALAECFGIYTAGHRTMAFAVGGALGALGGSLLALAAGAVSPQSFGIMNTLLITTGLILGGVGPVAGSVIGGIAVIFLPHWSSNLVSGPGSNLAYGVILIALMFLAPRGLVGIAAGIWRRVLVATRVVRPSPSSLDAEIDRDPP